MAQSMETMKVTFVKLMSENGFTPTGDKTHEGGTIYAREWRKVSQVAFYGERESTFRITASESYGYPLIRIFENGRPKDVRDYSSPKRAMNAIREIIQYAGYQF